VSPVVAVAAAVVAVAVVVVPWLRVVADARFRTMFPATAVVVAGAAVVWTVAVVVAAVLVAWLAVAAAVVVVAVALALLVRQAVATGPGRPPGSLSVAGSVRSLAHRDAYQVAARRHGPVFLSSQFGRPVVCVVGLERGQRLLRGYRHALGPSPLAFTEQVMGGFLRYMDDDTHAVYGPAFRQAMSRSVTESAAPVADAVITEVLAAVGPGAVPFAPLADQVAYRTLLWALLGLDADSPDGMAFTASFTRFARPSLTGGHRARRRDLEAVRSLVHHQAGVLAAAGDGCTVCALADLNTRGDLDDGVCIDNLVFMLRIGTANLSGLLVWMAQMLGDHQWWRVELAQAVASGPGGGADPGAGADTRQGGDVTDLVAAFVAEVLRLAQSEYLYRSVVSDVTFDGVQLRAGQLVRVCVAESHRDPAVFDEPDKPTDRFAHHRFGATEYCPFGMDGHACNAVGVAVMVARTLVAHLAGDPGVVITPAPALTRQLRHWSHWRPGPALTVHRAG
jgi:cytochrome P450